MGTPFDAPRPAWPEPPFVGRDRELAELEGFCADPRARVLHVEARGGMGKTSLLRAFARRSEAAGQRVVRIDGASTEARADVLGAALADARSGALVLIDELDALATAHRFLARELFRAIPSGGRVITAGRQPLPSAWTRDPDLHHAMRVLRLGPLDLDGTRALSRALALDEAQAEPLFRVSRGHPLLACLVASALRARATDSLLGPALDEETLVAEILRRAPSEAHREGLLALGLSELIDAPLLSAMTGLPSATARDVVRWLAEQPFVEEVDWGLRAHAIVRPLLEREADHAGARDSRERLRRAQDHLVARLDFGRPEPARALWRTILHVARREPEMAPFVGDAAHRLFPDVPGSGEWELVLTTIARHEGPASAAACGTWRDRPRTELTVLRDLEGAVRAFALAVVLEGDRPPVGDPVAEATWDALRLKTGQRAVLARSWMSLEHHVRPSPDLLSIFQATNALLLFEPDVHAAASVHALPELWQLPADHVLAPIARPSIDGTPYVVFATDFRARPREAFAAAWVRQMRGPIVEEPRLADERTHEADEPASVFALVRAALRDFHRGDALCASPLLDHPAVRTRAAHAEDRPSALRELLRERVRAFGEHGEDLRQRRIVEATFFGEPRKQPAIASELGLSLATYRRHLDRAVRRLADTFD
jgi:hypothetical protein